MSQTSAEEERDRSFLSDMIENAISGEGHTVRIDGFRGALSSQASVARLSIADAKGEWLIASDLVLDWTRSALFEGRVEVNRLSAGSIRILRSPQSTGSSAPTPEAVPFALPDLPVSINIGALTAEEIYLGADLVGQEARLSLEGAMSLAGGEGQASIAARRIDGIQGDFTFDGAFSNATRNLAVALDLSEGPGGMASGLIGLPGDPALALTVNGDAPLDSFVADLALATDGVDRVTGQLRLGTTTDDAGQTESAATLDLSGDVTPLLAPDYRDFFGTDLRLTFTGRSLGAGGYEIDALDIAAQAVRLSGAGRFGPGGWPEEFTLTGDLGSADGAPVRLPLSGDPVTVRAMDLDLRFDQAAGEGWTADFTIADLAGAGYAMPVLTLTGGGTITPEATAFTAVLDYAVSGLSLDDPALTQAVGSEASGQIAISRADGGAVTIDRLTLAGPGVAARLTGEIGAPVDRLPYDLRLDLDAADLSRFAALTGLDLQGAAELAITANGLGLDRSFAVTAAGGVADLSLGIAAADALLTGPGRLDLRMSRDAAGARIEHFAMTTDALSASGNVDLTSGDSAGAFDLRLDDVARLTPDLTGPASFAGRFTNGAAAGLSVDGDLSLPGAAGALTARRAAGAEVTTIDFDAAVPALTAFAAAAGLDLTGAADLRLTGDIGPGQDIALRLDGQTRDLGIGVAEADALIGGNATLGADIARGADGVLHLRDLALAAQRVTLTGRASQGAAGLDAEITAAITDLTPLGRGLSGAATVNAMISQDAAGRLTYDVAAGAMGADATLNGDLVGQDLTAALTLAASDLARLNPVTGQSLAGSLNLQAQGRLSADLSTLDVTLGGGTRDLAVGQPIAAPLLAGEGVFGGQIGRDNGGPFRLGGVSFATPGLRLQVDGLIDGPAVDADIAVTLPRIELIASGVSGAASLSGHVTRSATGAVTADLTGTAPGSTLALTAASDGDDPMAGITGRLTMNASDLGPWSRIAGRNLSGAVEMTANGRIVPADQSASVTIAATTRNINPGDATLARLLAGNGAINGVVERRANGAIFARDLNVAFPNLTITGEAEDQGGATLARFSARLADIGLFAPDFSGPATATGTARLNGATWTVDTDLTGPGGIAATVAGTVAAGGALNLTANGGLPLGLANGFIEPRRIEGRADFDLRVNGAAALENVGGQIRLSGATLSDPSLGMGLRDLGGTVSLAGGRANLDLSAAPEAGGRLAVSGGIGLSGAMAADLTVTAAGVALRDPELYDTTADGVIRLTGPLTGGAQIAGRITLGPTEIQIPSSGVGGLGDLPDVIHIGTPGAVAQTLSRAGLTINGAAVGGAASGGGGPAFGLDLTIDAPGRVFIRGRGLDAELGGSLHVGGTTARIVPAGGFQLIRGRLDILQQRFTLTEGRADLQGDFMPYLMLAAQTQARSGAEITITVEGPATAPEVSFTSSPELPQDEVLAQLLFGRDLSSITPLQAVQLAAAVGTLAGRGGGGIIDGLRTGLGVDDFDVITAEDGSAALRVGKYLTENIYTDVTVGQTETEVNLNLDLSRDVTVTGSVSSAGETSLGVFFERDY